MNAMIAGGVFVSVAPLIWSEESETGTLREP